MLFRKHGAPNPGLGTLTTKRARTRVAILAAVCGFLSTPAFSQPTLTPSDQAVLDAKDAYRRGSATALQAAASKTRQHLLAPLVAYWEMRLGLETASNDRIRQFLDTWAGTYYEDRLRNDWLRLLGARQDWRTFLQEHPRFRMQDDATVQCHHLHARLSTEDTLPSDAVNEVARLWMAQKDAEDACADVADKLIQQHQLPTQLAWQRARLGAEVNKPRMATQAVGLLDSGWAKSAQTILTQPERYLDDKLTAVRHQTKELVTLAVVKLATQQPADAADQLNKSRWRVQLTQEERSWAWGAVGKAAALRLMPEATQWFAKGQPEHMHPDHLAWWVRAALRQGQWDQVQRAIAAMPADLRADPTWTYWQARALLKLRANTPEGAAEARRLLQSIASPHHFYGQLALEELGQSIQTPPAPPPLTDDELRNAKANPGLQRALAAIALGLRPEGVKEWNYTTNLHNAGGMGDRDRLAAAQWACQQQVWDRCINTSERTRDQADHLQRYPMPLKDTVVPRARDIGLDPAYVYGLIRQESRFVTDARSHVGASGLMQVMPATARWTAKKIGLTGFTPSDLNERQTNVVIGTAYLKLVLDDFEGSMPMAAAAYNAGPGRPRQWRAPGGQGPVLEGAIWAENIPFNETRDYVKKVLSNTTNYAALISGQPQSLKARLGTVGPRTSAGQTPDLELP
jgi:soluble lytic murein transglycosylase